MAVNIVTGMTGKLHITSDDDRYRNAATFGKGKYVLNFGSKFAATVQSANLVRIMDGMLINQGTQMGIEPEDYEDVAIENGITGLNRNDIIVMRYIKTEETSIEQAVIEVVSGTSTSGTPQDPALTSGDILDGGDLVDDMPLYRVKVRGLQIDGLDTLFTVWQHDMEQNRDNIASLSSAKADKTAMTTELNKKVNKTDVQSTVNTSTNPVSSAAVNTALALKADKSNAWLLSGGTEIPANANLNNYTTVGNYYCISNDNASSLLNCPVQQAFTMKVIYSRGTLDIRQILTSYYDNQTFSRVLVYGSFGEWIKQPERSEITTINGRIDEIIAGQVHGVLAESVNDVLGAKNLFDYEAWRGCYISHGTAVFENSGVTLTATADDCYTADVTTTPKYPDNAYIAVQSGGKYTLSWEESTNTSGRVYVFYKTSETTQTTIATAYNSSQKTLDFTIPSSVTKISVRFGVDTSGSTISYKNIMLRPAAYESATFAPYAKSNRELTLDAAVLGENAGKNLLRIEAESRTINGITWTFDKETGIVKANGTATALSQIELFSFPASFLRSGSYVFSGASGGSASTYRVFIVYAKNDGTLITQQNLYDGETLVVVPSDASKAGFWVRVMSGATVSNVSMYPMIRPAGTSPDFAPYMYSNHEITTMMQGNENKNLLEITAETTSENNVTFTKDTKTGLVTASGTASAVSTGSVGTFTTVSGCTYVLSGCPSGGGTSNYQLDLRYSGNIIYADTGNSLTFTATENKTYDVRVRIASGYTANNLVFRPMIRHANTPPDFVPYRKTNELLTKEIDERWSLSGGIAIPSGADLNKYTAVENYYCSANVLASTLSNCPVAKAFIMKVYRSTGLGYTAQFLKDHSDGATYYRYYVDSWGSWIKDPTRAEITSINSSISSINTTLSGKVNTSDIQSSVNTSGNPVSSNAVNSAVSTLNSAIGSKLNSSVWTSFTNYAKPPYVAGMQGIVTQEGMLFVPAEGYKLSMNSSNFTLTSFQVRGYSQHTGLALACGNGYGNALQFDVSSYISGDEKGRTATASIDFGTAPGNWPTA